MKMPSETLMPDGTTRPTPAPFHKPQYEWTEEEKEQVVAFQEEVLRMQGLTY